MNIGSIMGLPSQYSAYGQVRDEYGSERTVHGSEIDPDSDIDDDFAYRVVIWDNHHESTAALVEDREFVD